MFEPSQLGAVAKSQLTAWEAIAEQWELVIIPETHARCHECRQSVFTVDFDGKAYEYTDEQRRALVVAHLRQVHMDLDPDRG